MKESPQQAAKARFQDKEKLVKALKDLATSALWVDRVNPRKGLGRVSNRKLLDLYDLLSEVKARFGSRSKLIDELLNLQARVKDKDYRTKLESLPTPRLWGLYQAAVKRHKKSSGAS